ncbi:MBL fold metallo-hydrolase (plasmid) [Bartonella sp. HY329]|uniref:MBL fold metallo-hydrolase n=1 Tax=unclassified Bartonella TaxID=2645622 RepID=UPI0021CAA24A|nr:MULTISPECIES: MBL fold metallo-hydrolase [unclassified Bartonella]UXM96541.1 MBL fold metallo-hydrolase [Bartonella sp. HY329]UXN10864.1 MBL fold metallo-hydrolase [Bartonella sp. HY328]
MTIINRFFGAVIAIAFTLFCTFSAHASDKNGLDISVYNPGDKGIFAVSSEIITGPSEVMLIDAQFSTLDATKLVEEIKATGKPLKTIFISHSDPDYYFGLETIKAAFPDAKILSTPQTVALIEATKDDKLAFWKDILAENAPKALIVPQPLEGDTLTLDGHDIKIIGLDGPAPERTTLWIADNKAVIGGVVVLANEHVWMADTQSKEARSNWIKILDKIEALQPKMVVPGHFIDNKDGSKPFTLASVQFTRDYINAFEEEAAKAKNSKELIAAMEKRYLDLEGKTSLEMSAQVIKGERQWPAK